MFSGDDVTALAAPARLPPGISRTFRHGLTPSSPCWRTSVSPSSSGGENFRLLGGRASSSRAQRAGKPGVGRTSIGPEEMLDAAARATAPARGSPWPWPRKPATAPTEPTQACRRKTRRHVAVIRQVAREREADDASVEHDMEWSSIWATGFSVLHFGQVIAEGTARRSREPECRRVPRRVRTERADRVDALHTSTARGQCCEKCPHGAG